MVDSGNRTMTPLPPREGAEGAWSPRAPRRSLLGAGLAMRALVWLHRRRFVLTVMLGLALVVATAAIRQRNETGIPPARFWATKLGWRACADCVVAGDSRVYIGLSPAIISGELGGCRVRNFAFNAAGYTPAYLDAIARVLDPASPRRTIVLGLTPHSLTQHAARRSNFVSASPKDAFEQRLEEWRWHCEPYQLENAVAWLSPDRPAVRYHRHTSPDGWVGTRCVPEDASRLVKTYEAWFRESPVDPQTVADVLTRVRSWVAAGICVYGFEPPIQPELAAVEQRLSGFDAGDFVRRFREAGGIWLETAGDYPSFDGSHLRCDAAIQFSRDLARIIRDWEAERMSPPTIAVGRDSAVPEPTP